MHRKRNRYRRQIVLIRRTLIENSRGFEISHDSPWHGFSPFAFYWGAAVVMA
jgi:hypothetical protein